MSPQRIPWDPTALAIYTALRRSADLRKSIWRETEAGAHFTAGHCYIATEAWYHLVGRAQGFVPHRTTIGKGTHWWCQHPDGRVVDITFEQFSSPVDYSAGRGSGFLTAQPSKRAQEIIARAGLAWPPETRAAETAKRAGVRR